MLKIGCQDPFPDEAGLPVEECEQLNGVFSVCWLTAGWGGVRRPDPNNVLIEVLRCRQWLGQDPIPIQLKEPAYCLFQCLVHRSVSGSACSSRFGSDFSSA